MSAIFGLAHFPTDVILGVVMFCDIDNIVKLFSTGDVVLTHKINSLRQLRLSGYLRAGLQLLEGPKVEIDLSKDYALRSLHGLPSSTTELNLSGLSHLTTLEGISRLTQLTRLNLYGSGITKVDLRLLPPTITDLRVDKIVNYTEIVKFELVVLHLYKLKHREMIELLPSTLTSLCVSNCNFINLLLDKLVTFPNITTLEINGLPFAKLEKLPQSLTQLSWNGTIECPLPEGLTSISLSQTTLEKEFFAKLYHSTTTLVFAELSDNINDFRRFTSLQQLVIDGWRPPYIREGIVLHLPLTLTRLWLFDIECYPNINLKSSLFPLMKDLFISRTNLIMDQPLCKLEKLVLQHTNQVVDTEGYIVTEKWDQIFPMLQCLTIKNEISSKIDLRSLNSLTSYREQEIFQVWNVKLPYSVTDLSIARNASPNILPQLRTANLAEDDDMTLEYLGKLTNARSLTIRIDGSHVTVTTLLKQLQALHPHLHTLHLTMTNCGYRDVITDIPEMLTITKWCKQRTRYLTDFLMIFETTNGPYYWNPLKEVTSLAL